MTGDPHIRDSLGVAVLKLVIIVTGLKPEETLQMTVPSKQYSNDGNPLMSSIVLTAKPGQFKVLRYQLMRSSTTSDLWGFSFGPFGDRYRDDISLTSMQDDYSQGMYRPEL